ncbi:MAG: YkgJ family cysteine cluster protein [Candidatus Poribacteria bacterium]
MKLDEIKALVSELNLENKFIKPEEVIFAIKDRGDLKTTFPIPNCNRCTDKCCPTRININLYDVAKFVDMGLDSCIKGVFSEYVDISLSEDGGKNVKISNPYMYGNPNKKDCVFMDDEQKCSIYENRPTMCRAFPITVRIDENKRKVALWRNTFCKDKCSCYDLCDNEPAFQSLLLNAVQYYNENLASKSLLAHSINRLKDIGLGKYINLVSKRFDFYNKCNNGSV